MIKYFLYAVVTIVVLLACVCAIDGFIKIDAVSLQKRWAQDEGKIETLQAVQDQWVEQVELLIIIDRLSFNLQCAELDKKELVNTLDKVIRENNELKFLVNQQPEPNTGIFKSDKST